MQGLLLHDHPGRLSPADHHCARVLNLRRISRENANVCTTDSLVIDVEPTPENATEIATLAGRLQKIPRTIKFLRGVTLEFLCALKLPYGACIIPHLLRDLRIYRRDRPAPIEYPAETPATTEQLRLLDAAIDPANLSAAFTEAYARYYLNPLSALLRATPH